MHRYQLNYPIGAGGMGTVYHALDRMTGDVVALKRIETSTSDALSVTTEYGLLQSITREFSMLAGLRHPNIISVLDYGFDSERNPFFTMKLLTNAQSIVQAAQSASATQRINYLLQLLRALAYLHRRGILHRDLKPANVLIADSTVRVLDLGLASLGTSTGEFAGTMAYMSPEMLRHRQYLPASDLYAVGVIATEMLTGQLPFPAHDIRAVLNEPPNLQKLDHDALRPVLLRLLEKEPTARYASPEQVMSDLAEHLGLTLQETPAIRESYLQAAPFIGRKAELAQLTHALQDTLDGAGGAWLIGGESGVGKSRLLSELRIRALTAAAHVYTGYAQQMSSVRYSLLEQPIAHLVLTTELSDFEIGVFKAALPRIAHLLSDDVSPVLPLDAAAEAQRLAYVIVNIIRRNAHPVVMILEDLQWAEESIAVLDVICRATSHLPLLVVGNYRSDEAPNLPDQLDTMQHLSLERFSREEIYALCTAMIGKAGENPDLVRRLQQESGGNVFFLIETLRYLAEQTGTLAQVSTKTMPPNLIPEGVAKIVERRLGFVPDWAQPLLNIAALAGRQIDLDLLRDVLPEPTDLDAWLYTCADASVLEIQDNVWRFSHDKLREALLNKMPPDEKVQRSRQLALAIEARFPDDETQAARLSEYWLAAQDVDRTLHYVLVAGAFLRRIGAYSEMRGVCERGVAVLRPTDSDKTRMKLYQFWGDACRYSDVETAQSAYQTALDICERNAWHLDSIGALQGLAVILRDKGQIQEAERLIDQSLHYAEETADESKLMSLLSLKARFFMLRGDYLQAQRYYERILSIAREVGDEIQMATQLMNLGAVICIMGRFFDQGRAAFHEAEQFARKIGAVDIVVYSLLNQANLASDLKDYTDAAFR